MNKASEISLLFFRLSLSSQGKEQNKVLKEKESFAL